MSSQLTFQSLGQQDDRTSRMIIEFLRDDPQFVALSTQEGELIVRRDAEDEAKLAVGIDLAIQRGTLEKLLKPPQARRINVHGRSADEVASELLSYLPASEKNVIVLQGLSGTGKGTTVTKLRNKLPNTICWSNGNAFRAFTLLISQYCEKNGIDFSTEILSQEIVAEMEKKLKFEKFPEGFDVFIEGVGRVAPIANTTLKRPEISQRVPTVAKYTQGEVIRFGLQAVSILQEAGHNVILEGRAQTLNFIPTTTRFELVVDNPAVLGQRRAAQRIAASAWNELQKCDPVPTEDEVQEVLRRVTTKLIQPQQGM